MLYSELEPEGQEAYYSQFIEKYNQQLGELYRQLVELRQQMAQLLGYESYTEVADLDMLRVGYTREDIRQFREDLKQTLTPIYRAYLEDFYSRAENRTQPGVVYLLGDPAPSPQGSWQQTRRVWRRSTTGCRSRRRVNRLCRPATATPICSPTR